MAQLAGYRIVTTDHPPSPLGNRAPRNPPYKKVVKDGSRPLANKVVKEWIQGGYTLAGILSPEKGRGGREDVGSV